MKPGDVEGIWKDEKGRSTDQGSELKKWQRTFEWGHSFPYFPSCGQYNYFKTRALSTIWVACKGNILGVCWVWRLTCVFIQWDSRFCKHVQLFQRSAQVTNRLLTWCHLCGCTCTGHPGFLVLLFSPLVDFALPVIAISLSEMYAFELEISMYGQKIGMHFQSLWDSSFKWYEN